MVESKYSSVLTTNTQRYFRDCGMEKYYYETIKVNVKETGNYSFVSTGFIKTYSYIYRDNFNPFSPKENLLMEGGVSYYRYMFQFTMYLQVNTRYILVVTTLAPNAQGNFSMLVTGPCHISLNHTCEYKFSFPSINGTAVKNIYVK